MTISFTAGQRVTASAINAFVPYYGRQGSDTALTTSPGNWAAGALSFAAGEVWYVEVFLDYGNFSTATNNIQVSWSVTGGATIDRVMTIGVAGATGSVTDTNGGFQSRTTGSVSYSGTTSTSVRGLARQAFVVTTTTAGTCVLAHVMSAGTGTLYASSFYIARRIS